MSNDNTRDQDRVRVLMEKIGKPAVNLSDADARKFVSVTGTASVSNDRADNRKVSM